MYFSICFGPSINRIFQLIFLELLLTTRMSCLGRVGIFTLSLYNICKEIRWIGGDY